MSRQILNGWKEISGYIQRSVRTVQRWEAQAGMPVHRPAAKQGAVVVAFTDELEAWLHGAPSENQPQPRAGRDDENMARLFEDVSLLVADAAELSSRVCMLQEQMGQLLPASHRRSATRRRLPRQARGCLLHFPTPAANAEAAR